MLSFAGYELSGESSRCSCRISKGNVAPKAIRCLSDKVIMMLRDWNGLSDTVLRVGHKRSGGYMQESAVSNAV